MTRRIVPDVISNQTLAWVSPSETARSAARLMRERKVAAVLVMESDRLVGIITERDMTCRVVAASRDARSADDRSLSITASTPCRPPDI